MASGAVADKIIREQFGVEIVGWVSGVGPYEGSQPDIGTITREQVDKTDLRCPDMSVSEQMRALILSLKEAGDSTGGIISCVIRNVPAGIGEPVYEKLEAKLAQAMLAIPATKGFEIGSGFSGTRLKGSQHNDPFIQKENRLGTTTNNSGGIQGGIANGESIFFRVAFKPPATISLEQETANYSGDQVTLQAKGRHDPCVVPRATPIVESMASLVILDMILRQEARKALSRT